MKKLETELSNIKISASTSSTEKENPINMKDVMTELERTEASPPARSSDASVNLNKKPLDMKEIASELDQIKVTPPKGLSNMKDLDHEVNNIISALPEVTSGASHLYKHTLIAQKSAAAGSNRKRVANPPALSKQERESKLETITPSALNIEHKGKSSGVMAAVLLCKFIQCALWDAGFQYALLNYQFDAVLAAAGVDVRVLLDIFIKWNDLQRSVLVSQCDMGQKMRVDVCKDCVKFAKTRGLLVAGELWDENELHLHGSYYRADLNMNQLSECDELKHSTSSSCPIDAMGLGKTIEVRGDRFPLKTVYLDF